jgi:hypothetical protein
MRATEDFKDTHKPAEYQDIVKGLGSIPATKPRLSFRLKVAWRSRMTGAPSVRQRSTASGEERTGLLQLPRAAAIAFLTVCVAGILFFGLTLLARGSHPGDTLYVFKVAREKISMVFTGDPVTKARKNLDHAQERLKELDYFVSNKKIDPDRIKYIARQYNENKVQVQKVIAQKGAAPDGNMLASELQNLETQKANILDRMSVAVSPAGILAPAAGARVSVRDAPGSRLLGGGLSDISGQADGSGRFEFDYALSDKNRVPELDTTVELDGYKTISPVFAPVEQPLVQGQLEAVVEPRINVIALGESEPFALRLNRKGGENIGGMRLVLEDRSGTSLINGQSGKVDLVPGNDGSCSFTVTKTSSAVSRISLSVFDGTPVEMGDVLVLGTTEKVAGGSAQQGGVTARVTPSISGNRVELDNGRVQVVADSDTPYAIIKSLNVSGNKSIDTGSLEDMLAVPGVPGVNGPVETKGPSLTYSNGDSAAYEVDVNAKLGELAVHRVYEVSLAEGNDFASISCKTSYESSSSQPSKNPNLGPVPGIRLRRGSDTRIGEVSAGSLVKSGQRATISFDRMRPFVTDKSSGKGIVLCYPTRGPDSWEADTDFVYTSYGEGTSLPGIMSETTSFLGFSNEGDVPSMINKALETRVNVLDGRVGPSWQDWGFEIECTPALSNLREGRQRLTLTIRKKYEKLSDYFVSNK